MDHLATEKHYTPNEVGDMWGLSAKVITKLFQDQPAVDHPPEQCEFCDSPWTVQLNDPYKIETLKVCADCARHWECEKCNERVGQLVETYGCDESGPYETRVRLCRFCRDEVPPQPARVIPIGFYPAPEPPPLEVD